ISALRLKMRTRAEFFGSSAGSTNVVSLRLNSAASDCSSWSLSPRASGTTASGLPPKRCSVKTSTVTKEKRRIVLYRPASVGAAKLVVIVYPARRFEVARLAALPELGRDVRPPALLVHARRSDLELGL